MDTKKEGTSTRDLTATGEKPKVWESPLPINVCSTAYKHCNNGQKKETTQVISDLGIRNQMQNSQDPANSEAALHYSATYKLLTCDDMTKRGNIKACSGANVSRFILRRIKKLKVFSCPCIIAIL